jgi:dihydroorotate dehydrogenase electron transfer subunit
MCIYNPHFANPKGIWHGTAPVVENVRLARDTFRIRLACPEIAGSIVPGQFVMLRLAGSQDPLLGRPLALYDVYADDNSQYAGLDIVYLVVGKMTRLLADILPGTTIEVWGPLGNGFPPVPTEHLVLVAGGIGQTPMLALGGEYLGRKSYGTPERQVPRAKKVTLCYGARSAEYLAGVDDFQKLGIEVRLSTEDGSAGTRGYVTELIGEVVERSAWPCRIACCGPKPMLAATAEIARGLGLPCQVSLETHMACGIGICFSCVAKIRDGSVAWDYRRTCREGPVFDAEDVEF